MTMSEQQFSFWHLCDARLAKNELFCSLGHIKQPSFGSKWSNSSLLAVKSLAETWR
jgi:hypothetical protein